MAGLLDPCELLAAQRQLRVQLLDRQNAISWPGSRELAARLLLQLDDPANCWQLSADWIRDAFDVERVDAGTGSPNALTYLPARAESRSKKMEVRSLRGVRISNSDPAVTRLWNSSKPIVFPDISQERLFRSDLRNSLLAVGTRSKIAVALQHQGHRFGLLCIDHIERSCEWHSEQYTRFDSLAREVLSPILLAAARLSAQAESDWSSTHRLTPAEVRVARLAASGLSYKAIARSLNRSFSTVDHQLRSIREKLGVRTNGQLIMALSRHGESLTQ